MVLTKNHLERLEQHQLADLAEFIVYENFSHHTDNKLPTNHQEEIKSIFNEEVKYYQNSQIFVAKDYLGMITGSIRVLKWNFIDLLPLQKIFGFSPLTAIPDYKFNEIFHIGRFAIKKNVRDIKLLKQLMVCAIRPVCEHKENIAFAECDSKLLRILKLMGIKAKVLGDSVNYLGSETIPISMNYDGLIDFYNKNKGLVSEESFLESQASNIHKSVVLDYYQHYYSFV